MSFPKITIERLAEDQLERQVWTFSLFELRLVLTEYTRATRASKRHAWRQQESYDYLKRLMPKREVPWPADLEQAARTEVLKQMVVTMDLD